MRATTFLVLVAVAASASASAGGTVTFADPAGDAHGVTVLDGVASPVSCGKTDLREVAVSWSKTPPYGAAVTLAVTVQDFATACTTADDRSTYVVSYASEDPDCPTVDLRLVVRSDGGDPGSMHFGCGALQHADPMGDTASATFESLPVPTAASRAFSFLDASPCAVRCQQAGGLFGDEAFSRTTG